jgi:hypothetical protein
MDRALRNFIGLEPFYVLSGLGEVANFSRAKSIAISNEPMAKENNMIAIPFLAVSIAQKEIVAISVAPRKAIHPVALLSVIWNDSASPGART